MTEDNIVKLIIALIGLFGTLIGLLVGYIGKTHKQSIIDAKREQKQQDTFNTILSEMESIKKRLDCHNGYAKKFEENNKELATINNKLTGLQKDIDYLKSDKCHV